MDEGEAKSENKNGISQVTERYESFILCVMCEGSK
jgi:hypothetical protein